MPRLPQRRHYRAQAPREPCLPRVRRRAAAKPTGERLGSQVRSSPHPHHRPGPAGLLRCRHRRCAPADGERAALSAAGGTRMSTPAHACAPALDDRPVLATAPLKAGHAREELSRVGDPSWDLGPAVFRENARRCHVTVHFDVLEHADVQAAMRAYLYARLNVDLPGYGAKLPPASIRQAFNRARRFFAFARERFGRLDLGRIDQALVDAYARHLRDDPARRPVIRSDERRVGKECVSTGNSRRQTYHKTKQHQQTTKITGNKFRFCFTSRRRQMRGALVTGVQTCALPICLNVDLPGYGAKLPPASIRQAFNRARRFFAFARERFGRLDLGRIDQALVDAYARHLRDDPARRPVIVGQLLQVVTDLYHLRDHLPDGGLGFEPWAGRAAARVAGYRHVRENRTPRMPEEIVTPLLAGSLRYITTFATDILAARAALDRLEARRARLLAAERGLPDAERDRKSTRLNSRH